MGGGNVTDLRMGGRKRKPPLMAYLTGADRKPSACPPHWGQKQNLTHAYLYWAILLGPPSTEKRLKTIFVDTNLTALRRKKKKKRSPNPAVSPPVLSRGWGGEV